MCFDGLDEMYFRFRRGFFELAFLLQESQEGRSPQQRKHLNVRKTMPRYMLTRL